MAANFTLTLDTTGPAAVAGKINSDATYTTTRAVTLGPTTSDGVTTGYQIKIWGDVDLAADANIQATEGASTWITLTAAMAVTLSTGDGVKNLTWRMRDDVWNTSATATDSITLDTTVPVVTLDSGPTPAKVSTVATKDSSIATWHSDADFQAYKVKVVPSTSSIHSAGVQIPTTAGSTFVSGGAGTAATTMTTTIKGADLQTAGAEGGNIVKVFVQDLAGNWSV